MPHSFTYRRRIEFAETDMAGIVHFANFFRFMEEAEHAFFRSFGRSVHNEKYASGGGHGWVRVDAQCNYRAPLRYEDEAEIRLTVRDKRRSSIRYECEFWVGETHCATGNLTVVCVQRDDEGQIRAVPMPDEIDAQIEVAPE